MAFKTLYRFSKPGIVYANLITGVAGYLFASHFRFSIISFGSFLLGLALVIIGACASNNVLDRRVDAAMPRTQRRALVTAALPLRIAILYAAFTTIAGMALLVVAQNQLTVLLVALAWFDYVVLYGIGKRRTVHGTLVGCISGALPLVAGYTAVANRLDVAAWLLFALMVVWQMGHFYGIALYRLKDYQAGRIPVMPAVYGARSTQVQAVGYIIIFIIVGALLGLQPALGLVGGTILCLAGGYWLYRALASYKRLPSDLWGKRVFLTSLIVMLVMATALSLGPLLV